MVKPNPLALVSVWGLKELRSTENDDGSICEHEVLGKDREFKGEGYKGHKDPHAIKHSRDSALNNLCVFITTKSTKTYPISLIILNRFVIPSWS